MSFENVFNDVSFELFAARASMNLCATTDCLIVQYSSNTYLKNKYFSLLLVKYYVGIDVIVINHIKSSENK